MGAALCKTCRCYTAGAIMLWLQHTLLADPAQGAGLRKNGGLHDTQGVLKTQAQRYAYGVQRVVGDILNLTCLLPYGIKN